jgi:hypothetical protein
MSTLQMPSADKFMNRLFRKAEGVVWDLMSGKIGVQTKEGIATIEGEGEDAQIVINVMDQFGMEVPAFAQSTPIEAVKPGDIIYFGSTDRPGWVTEKKVSAKGDISFILMKADGTRSTWKPPKISMLGLDSGVMVLRSLLTMLPGGAGGLTGLQGMMMPMLMMGGDMDMEKMMPMMLMSQLGTTGAPVLNPDGTPAASANPMASMMPMLMMMSMMKGDSPFASKKNKNSPFN